ncbi:MAG: 8-amino-7-oxononanoate synthase [Actinobacteria bacterium]|nr:8-amino-7-oxononanoate synthase [Actinomycetota bacterium]
MTRSAWVDDVAERLDAVRAAGRWRAPRDLDGRGPSATLDGRPVVAFASNDYLGLTVHPAVVAAAAEALERWGAGAGSARLVTGSRPVHDELERELAQWKGTERTVLFPTGYQANLGVLAALGSPGTRILSDELNHASIIDGCRLARAETSVFPHGDLAALDDRLGSDDRPALVVSDTVFSMDGDVADVAGLLAVCARHGALLVLDEAHAVLGPDVERTATGACPPAGDVPVVRVGTLSKALGSLGGFAACSAPVADLLVNAARPYIFTTASPPATAAAALAALRIVRSAEGAGLRARLRHLVDRLAPGHPSPIVPVVLGGEERALAAAAALADRGLFVPAIRPPTVAPGSSRLRVTLSAAHTDDQVDALLDGLAAVGVPLPA